LNSFIKIIIPNCNGKVHLTECLESIGRQSFKDYKVIIIDNNSTDGSIDFIEINYPEANLIKLNYNSGFSKAVNIGIKYALEDSLTTHIVLLNNDIECDINFLSELISGFINDKIGTVSPKMFNYYNRVILDDTGNFIIKKGLPFSRGQGEIDIGQYDESGYIFGACAGAAIYKREVFEKVGFFDEDYFAYYEDVDFSFRLQLQGYKCIYNPRAICYHKRGGTLSNRSRKYIYLIERNLFFLRLKNYPLSILITYSLYYNLARIKRFLDYWKKESFGYSFSALKGYLTAIINFPKVLQKRKSIQKNRIVPIKYIKSILQ